MKKLFYLLMMTITMVSFIACSSSDEDGDSSKDYGMDDVELMLPESTLTFNDQFLQCITHGDEDKNSYWGITFKDSQGIFFNLCLNKGSHHCKEAKEWIGKNLVDVFDTSVGSDGPLIIETIAGSSYDYFIPRYKSGKVMVEDAKLRIDKYPSTTYYYNYYYLKFENYVLSNRKSENDSQYKTMTINGTLKFTILSVE